MPGGQFQNSGAQPQKPTKAAVIYQGRFFQGLYTNRSPLRMGGMTWVYEKYYGGMNDALIGGLNTEVTNRLTLGRRPGNPVYTNPTSGVVSASFTDVDRFESFHLLSPTAEEINVMIDEAGGSLWTGLDAAGLSAPFGDKKTLVFEKSTNAGQAFMESVGNVLYFGDQVDQKKWIQSITVWPGPNQVLSAGQYPFFSTYLVDPNFNLQQLIATVLSISGSNSVTIAADGVTVTLKITAGQVASTGLVAGTVPLPQSGNLMFFQGLSVVTQLNDTFGYVTNITGDTITVVLVSKVASQLATTDSGLAVIVQGGTPTTGATTPTWATTVLTPSTPWPYPANVLTVDGTALWIDRSAPTGTQAEGIFNWGIKGPTGVLAAPQTNVGSGAWRANTFYSLDSVVIATNANGGDLWQVTVAGAGGTGAEPFTSGHAVGFTVTDNGVTWTLIQLQASLTWASNGIYVPQSVTPSGVPIPGTGSYVVATAGGVPCLYQLQPTLQPLLVQQPATPAANMTTGDYVDLYYYTGTGSGGLFNPRPAVPGSAAHAATVNSLLFNVGPDPNEQPMVNFTLKQSGEISGTTTPFASATSNYSMVALFSVLITPEFMATTNGQCSLLISHDDGMLIACAQSGVTWGGPQNLNGQSVSAMNSYALLGGNNVNGDTEDTGTLTFPSAGVYDFEINYFQKDDQQTLVVQMNGYTPPPTLGPFTITSVASSSGVYTGTVPGGAANAYAGQYFTTKGFVNAANNLSLPSKCTASSATTLTLTNPNSIAESASALATCASVMSMVTAPTFPVWGVGSAPGYPAVTEQGVYPGNGFGAYKPTGGVLVWNNHGPAADFVWKASQNFTQPDDIILDTNGNSEGPYRTGYTGTVQPVWSTTLNSLTLDNPNLIWINKGAQASSNIPGILPAVGIGWRYGVALVNTLNDTVSNMSQLSATTGPFIGAAFIQLPPGFGLPPASQIDPQADWVAIFRTTDGGSIPFLIPGIDNSIYTLPLSEYLQNGYKDTTPDVGLNNELQGAQNGENTPPAQGAVNLVYSLNRIWFSIGNVVYWTTGPADPIGNGLEGVSPFNFDQMPALVKRLVPSSIGMLVFTISDIYLIPGQGTASNPIQPGQPYLPGVGILSYNALDVCGTIISILTTDGTYMMIDPGGGFIDAGQPIGDQFGLRDTLTIGQNWNPSDVYIAWYVNGEDQAWYIADGFTGWYRMCSTPSPETGYSWSPFAQIEGGTFAAPSILAVQSVEVQPGVRKLLIGPAGTGPILNRDTKKFADGGITSVSVPNHLSTAEDFALLANQAITGSTGAGSAISGGNIGIAPNNSSSVTNFPPSTLTAPGVFHYNDVAAQQAQVDLTTAIAYYSGLSFTSLGSVVDLSTSGNGATASTYIAGNYSASSSMDIPTSITLDAQGNPNAVFVFKAGSTLTLESGASVTLVNGAQAANVYWVVGSSFTSIWDGSSSNMVGTIMAAVSITLGGGTLSGRALASTGSITLSTTEAVTVPTVSSGTFGAFPYRAFADIGSLVLANPGQLAGVNFITTECVRLGLPHVLGVLFDEAEPYTTQPFDILKQWDSDPTNLPKSRSILAQRFYMSDDDDLAAVCRHMQMRIDWGVQSVQNELFTLSVFGIIYAES